MKKILAACLFLLMMVSVAYAENVITVVGPEGTETLTKVYYRIEKGGEYVFSQSNPDEELEFNITVSSPDEPVTIKLAGLNIKPLSTGRSYHALNISNSQSVTINLVENTVNTLKGYGGAGIRIDEVTDVIIEGEGTLYAYGSSRTAYNGYSHSYHYCAGIQKGQGNNSLTINGGTIYAYGSMNCAGIGGNFSSYPGAYGGSSSSSSVSTSNIYINGGTIHAQGRGGAGIGGAYNAKATNIVISGGKIWASGYQAGAGDRNVGDGIGNGRKSSGIVILPAKRTVISARAGNSREYLWEKTFRAECDITDDVRGHSLFELDSEVEPCKHTGQTEIRNAKDPTYEEKGYTGDVYCLECGELIERGCEIPKLNKVPQTGDASMMMLWGAMTILSLLGISALRKRAY